MLKIFLSLFVLSVVFSIGVLRGDCDGGLRRADELDFDRSVDLAAQGKGQVHIPNSLRGMLKGKEAVLLQFVPRLVKGEMVYAFSSGENLILAFAKPQSPDFFLVVEVQAYFRNIPAAGFKIVKSEHQPVDAIIGFNSTTKFFQIVSVQSIIKALNPDFRWLKIIGFENWKLIPREAWLNQPIPMATRLILPKESGDWFAWVEKGREGKQELVFISDLWHWVYATQRRREDKRLKYGIEGDRHQRFEIGTDEIPSFIIF